jgi:hypothetical protein
MDLFGASVMTRNGSGKTNGHGILGWLGGGGHHPTGHDHSSIKAKEEEEELKRSVEMHRGKEPRKQKTANDDSASASSDQDASADTMTEDSEDNDSDNDDNEGVDEYTEDRDVANLPSSSKLDEIFGKLMDFKLAKIMVRSVVHPSTEWVSLLRSSNGVKPSLNVDEIEKKINPIDAQLEANIKLLFGSDKYSIENIKKGICAFARNPDSHTLSTDQKKKIDNDKKLLKNCTPDIQKFYPHLLNAMKALIVYIQQNSETKGKLAESEYDKRAFCAWEEVFTYLKSIQLVIFFGVRNGQLNISNFPKNFSVIITNMEKKAKNINKSLMQKRIELQKINEMILQRDSELLSINQKYNGIENHKSDLKGKLDALHTVLRQGEDPLEITKENIALLNEGGMN